MAQRSELDYLIYNDPLAYAELILNRPNGDTKFVRKGLLCVIIQFAEVLPIIPQA